MERRYKLMAAVGVRNLAGFNKKVKDAEDAGQPMLDPLFQPNPDCRTCGRAAGAAAVHRRHHRRIRRHDDDRRQEGRGTHRAAGAEGARGRRAPDAGHAASVGRRHHRPDQGQYSRRASRSRSSSKIDSRTILDQSGAETLLGHGDMLYLPPGTATPERVHGAFVDDHEVHSVVEQLRAQGRRITSSGVLEEVQAIGDGKVINDSGLPQEQRQRRRSDALYDRAVRIVTETRRASISGVQRHLRIGYNRAARLIEQMEAAGVVSPPEHNGNREVLAPPPPKH